LYTHSEGSIVGGISETSQDRVYVAFTFNSATKPVCASNIFITCSTCHDHGCFSTQDKNARSFTFLFTHVRLRLKTQQIFYVLQPSPLSYCMPQELHITPSNNDKKLLNNKHTNMNKWA